MFATLRLVVIFSLRSVGRLFFRLFKRRRRIALENVDRCFSHLSEKVRRRIVKKSFANLGHTLADFLILSWYKKSDVDRYCSFKNFHYLEESLCSGRGVIISTAHFGSWELAAHFLALKGFKSLIVYNKFKKPSWLDDAVKKRRELSGNKLVLKKYAFLSIYKELKRGRMVTLLTDQHAFPPDGIKTVMFGQDVWTHSSFVRLSLKTGALIVPAFMFVKGYRRYEIVFHEPIDPKKFVEHDDPVKRMVEQSNNALVGSISSSPDLWMWQHRRFKNV